MVAARTAVLTCACTRVAHVERAFFERAVVAKHVGLDLLRVAHRKPGRATGDEFALVAHLAAAFGVERRGVQHDHTVLTGFQLCTLTPST
jgi:hypothetical protein